MLYQLGLSSYAVMMPEGRITTALPSSELEPHLSHLTAANGFVVCKHCCRYCCLLEGSYER